jgi:MFS family permease
VVVAAAPALWVFYAGWLILGLGMAAGLYDPAFASLGRLYGREARGPITLLTLWGGFASTVCWPLSAVMLEAFGWRGVALAYAAIHLFGTLPLVWFFIPRANRPRDTPADRPLPPARLQGTERMIFALIAAMLIMSGLIVVNITTHLLTCSCRRRA